MSGMTARLVAIFPLVASCAWAQFFGLAATGDGSRLYFATPLRQKNSTQPDYGKLFRIDASGLALQKSIPYQPPPTMDPFTPSLGNAYDLQAADVSSDGQVFAAVARRDCYNYPDAGCYKMSNLVTTITVGFHHHGNAACSAGGLSQPAGPAVPKRCSQVYDDSVRLSANGKWAFGGTGTPLYSNSLGYLVNVSTGEQTLVAAGQAPLNTLPGSNPFYVVERFQVSNNGRPIANDGTAVFSDSESLVLLQGSQARRIPLPNHDLPSDAAIDADAYTIVYAETAAIEMNGGISLTGSTSLRVADVATGQIAMLASDGHAPSLSDDSGTVLYLSNRDGAAQAWLIHTDGTGDRVLTHDPLGIARAILSGDGSTAYAVTLNGQLLKVTVASDEIEELIPRTPYLDPSQSTAPGKLTTLTGEGLVDFPKSAAPPLPYTLEHVSVTIEGEPTRISSVQPTSLTVLTPPDLMVPPVYPNTASIRLDVASPSPFDAPVASLQIRKEEPEFLEQMPLYVLGAHEDWSGLVTTTNPAHPGEVLHAYAIGLGLTAPAVPYGAAAPAQEPLARLVAPYRCFVGQVPKEVSVFYQGLAPNSAGTYQIDWSVPSDAPSGDLGIVCQMGATVGSFPSFSGRIPVGP